MKLKILFLLTFLISLPAMQSEAGRDDPNTDQHLRLLAEKIHREAIVIDTHCDTPMALLRRSLDIGSRLEETDVDLVRMREGGVDALFFAVFISNRWDEEHPAKRALEMIDEIHLQIERNPAQASLALSSSDIRRIHQTGKRAILIGMENGGPVEGSLRVLRTFYRLGVRYITLTHGSNNAICDSSTADKPKWDGLSPFGEEVVQEMNRLGMMVDVSHISDSAFWDVLKLSNAPVMASHSCVRAICDVPRNLSDDMIRALAAKGGVIQINFYSGFLCPVYKEKSQQARKKLEPELKKLKEKFQDNQNEYWQALFRLWKRHAPPPPKIDILLDHIDHVVKLVGVDHVGLGSDYDGAGSFPEGLEDVSGFPLITYHLLKRGYDPGDVKKILGGNLLRVFAAVEKTKESLERTD
jgi:membrane dipeptidase